MPKKNSQLLFEFVLLSCVTFLYSYGVLVICRENILVQAAITIILPVLFWKLKLFKSTNSRVLELLGIESIFLILAFITKIAINYHLNVLNNIMTYAILLWFALQVLGFFVWQIKRRSASGVLMSTLGGIMIFLWFLSAHGQPNRLSANGNLLFWGVDAPLLLQLYYAVWFVHVVFIDSASLPNLRQASMQLASVIIALFSGAFFYARILTACNLFFLDAIFNITNKDSSYKLAVFDENKMPGFIAKIRPFIRWFCVIACSVLFICYMIIRFKGLL